MDCPVCSTSLDGKEEKVALEHVNNCLDLQVNNEKFIPMVATRQTSMTSFLDAQTSPIKGKEMPLQPLKNLPQRNYDNDQSIVKAHKWILDSEMVMDSFGQGPIAGVKFYFLSHFHSDHYQGLGSNFDWGIIVCTRVTGNLCVAMLGVNEERIMRIDTYEWIELEPNTVAVMAVDAAHCPGSAMFIFRINCQEDPPKYILHTGDFRASQELINDKRILELGIPKFSAVYLDTTYSDPQYSFPRQNEAIESCCRIVDRLVNKHDQRLFVPIRRVVLIGSYLIGKEKIALAVAKLLNVKIYCSTRKRAVFKCLEWPEFNGLLTSEAKEAGVHIVGMRELDSKNIGIILDAHWPRWTHALAIRPTGWTFGKSESGLSYLDHVKKDSNGQLIKRKDAIALLSTPYSEHSSFSELIEFLSAPWLKYDWIIPTVDNPTDLYLHSNDYNSVDSLLLAWSNRKRNS